MPTADRKHLETKDFWRFALHGTASHGRNVDLGYLRQFIDRSSDLPNTFYHCSKDDERSSALEASGAGGLHV
jgi:hypothetical protein